VVLPLNRSWNKILSRKKKREDILEGKREEFGKLFMKARSCEESAYNSKVRKTNHESARIDTNLHESISVFLPL
jgi:hypothetical protein